MDDIVLSGPKLKLKEVFCGQLLLEALQNGGSKIAMVDAETEKYITYEEMLQYTISLAQNLRNMGIEKHDVISVCSKNSLYYSIPVIAAAYLGLPIAPISQFYVKRELEHVVSICKPKIIFCTSDIVEQFVTMSQELKFLKKIIVINKCDEIPESVLKLEDLLYSQIPKNFTVTEVKPDDVFGILSSSGTSGLPKGVMITQQGFSCVLNCLQHPEYGRFSQEEIGLGLLPFCHSYGLSTLLCMIITNLKMIILVKFEEHMFLRTIQNYKITHVTLVSPLIIFLSKSPLVQQYDLSSLKDIFSGGTSLSKDIQDAVKKRLNIDIRQGYGLTELSLVATLQPQHVSHAGSVGILVPGMECKVIDIETGKSLRSNQSGELLFRSSQVMKGYAQNPEATAETIDADGWLHTGDIGYYDEEQYFYIVDRYKELIKYKGFQVSPAEIEEIILTLTDVLDCAVIGKPDDTVGELPYAFVVKKLDSTITEKEIYNHVADNLSHHKWLRGGIKFVSSIPKNSFGKILRRVLREM